jgi:AcrR family transcriptional regulator
MRTLNKKTHILDIAEELFCRYGPKETTVRVITQKAGINTAMLNYYFRSKENLFLSVLERKIKSFSLATGGLPLEGKGVMEQLTGYSEAHLDLIADYLPFYRLMAREKLQNEDKDALRLINTYFSGINTSLKALIDKGIAEQKIRVKDTDSLLANVTGLLVYAIFTTGNEDFLPYRGDTLQLKAHLKRMFAGTITELPL